jgi:hypothetical protein
MVEASIWLYRKHRFQDGFDMEALDTELSDSKMATTTLVLPLGSSRTILIYTSYHTADKLVISLNQKESMITLLGITFNSQRRNARTHAVSVTVLQLTRVAHGRSFVRPAP